jgi:hypothetical protein
VIRKRKHIQEEEEEEEENHQQQQIYQITNQSQIPISSTMIAIADRS